MAGSRIRGPTRSTRLCLDTRLRGSEPEPRHRQGSPASGSRAAGGGIAPGPSPLPSRSTHRPIRRWQQFPVRLIPCLSRSVDIASCMVPSRIRPLRVSPRNCQLPQEQGSRCFSTIWRRNRCIPRRSDAGRLVWRGGGTIRCSDKKAKWRVSRRRSPARCTSTSNRASSAALPGNINFRKPNIRRDEWVRSWARWEPII